MDQDAVLKTVRQFKKALESINIRVEQLILYGSHAVNKGREDSDINVVVISPGFYGKGYWERIDILTEAIYKVFAPIEASAFTPDEWKAEKFLIVDYARNGVLVHVAAITQPVGLEGRLSLSLAPSGRGQGEGAIWMRISCAVYLVK